MLVLQRAQQQAVVRDGETTLPLGIRVSVMQIDQALQLLLESKKPKTRTVISHQSSYLDPQPSC